jgi:glyoxylase-like metal-dependent hydrolase (beta-lactamase superfamily II)
MVVYKAGGAWSAGTDDSVGRGQGMRTLRLGDSTIDKVVDEDAGSLPYRALFPQADWSLFEDNCGWLDPACLDREAQLIHLSFHTFVIHCVGKVVLIETCIGNDKRRGGDPLYHCRRSQYLTRLSEAGVDRTEVDYVICTHMHADHVGWNTQFDDGVWRPTFPNAKYIFVRSEFAYWKTRAEACADGEWQEASYFDSVLPIVEAGQAVLVEEDYVLMSGLYLRPAPGHSPGHSVVWFERAGRACVFTGDLVHHAIQLASPGLVPAYDMNPARAALSRRDLLRSIADTRIIMLTAHFPGVTAGRVRQSGAAYEFHYINN